MIIDGSFAIEFKARGAWPVGLVMVGGVNGGCFGGDQVCLCGFFSAGESPNRHDGKLPNFACRVAGGRTEVWHRLRMGALTKARPNVLAWREEQPTITKTLSQPSKPQRLETTKPMCPGIDYAPAARHLS